MRIKQIELNGFKSFMNRTVLELPLGVTAVVGPNGCGKSNVVDAIRWVLGEQSPKHLRGGAMEDVIFAGNADHAPLGMAEVSLLLERSEEDLLRAAQEAGDVVESADQLPPELRRASEVLVTRRYFRSGESEYLINRASCRLRDITELFLGTGVGTKAYAIIEQGRVEQLVNAKPEDMRLFLEEAAGTTRFRARKVAAERKMERTRENLLRIQDVLHELERQIASLQRQAKRAEQYHEIRGELRALDVRVTARRRRQLLDETTLLTSRHTALEAEETTVVDALGQAEAAAAAARARRADDEARLQSVSARIADHRLRAGEGAARAESARTRRTDLAARASEAARDVERLRARRVELEREGAALGTEFERLRQERDALVQERDAATARLQQLVDDVARLERRVEQAKDAVVAADAEAARLHGAIETLHRRRADVATRRTQLEETQRHLGERLASTTTSYEAAEAVTTARGAELEQLTSERTALAERRAAAVAEEERLRQAREEASAQLTQLRSRADSLRELQARHEGCTRGTASLLGRADEPLVLLASVLRVPAALERAVAAALGTRLGDVVVASTAEAVRAVEWLATAAAGSAAVLPRAPRPTPAAGAGRRLLDEVEVDPEHAELAAALLGNVLVCDDLQSAFALWQASPTPVTVVTAAGEAIDPMGAVSGGSEPPMEETLLARARELRELAHAIDGASGTLHEATDALGATHAHVEELTTATAAVDERLQTTRLELLAAQKDRERLQAERERTAAELDAGTRESAELERADDAAVAELAGLDTALATADADAAGRRAEHVDAQQALAAWRAAHAHAEAARTTAAVHAAEAIERCRALDGDAARVRAAIDDVDERVSELVRVGREAEGGAADAADEAAAAEAIRAEADAAATALGVEREALVATMAEADTRVAAEELAQRDLRMRLDALRQERSAVDVALAEHRVCLTQLLERLTERWDVGVEALENVAVDDGDADADATRAEDLRARLVRLGDVNPGAVAELAEVRDRQQFLAAQRADLETSLTDLQHTIAKLTQTSRHRFEETFAAANEKLADVFPKVFPHGRARLQLTEPPEEGGEPGVEIVVQLAGKKLQSLSLLSGGEKALTATALVFSLFLIRPTPFCLLDEVDAPLDEANIGRFNQLVTEMSDRSQFVLITHNRRTMEVAETLYGITMEQAGVSKVVSVRLHEAA